MTIGEGIASAAESLMVTVAILAATSPIWGAVLIVVIAIMHARPS